MPSIHLSVFYGRRESLLLALAYLVIKFISAPLISSEIHTAVIQQDMEKVRDLAKLGEGVFNIPDLTNDKRTPLLYAIAANNAAMVELMLAQASTNVELADANGTTPLKLTLEHKNLPILILLLDHGVNLDLVFSDHQTPDELCLAAGPEIIQQMLKHKRGILQDRTRTFRFLRTALKMNHPELLNDLLKLDPELKSAQTGDLRQDTLIHLVAADGNATLVQEMIKVGFDPNKPNGLAITPFQIAFTEALNGDTADCLWTYEKKTILQQLKDAKDPQKLADYLNKAFRAGAVQVAKDVLIAGAKFNSKALGAECPLILAMASNRPAMIDFLTSKGLGVNSVVSTDGDTALVWALKNGKFSSAKLLLEKGANPTAKTKTGIAPLMSLLPMLWSITEDRQAEKPTTPIAINQCLELTRFLLEHGGWLQLSTRQKDALIQHAIAAVPDDTKHPNFIAADALLTTICKQPGVKTLAFDANTEGGTTPAEYALLKNKQLALTNLIANKVDMKMPNSKTPAPLCQAIVWYTSHQRSREFLELLLNADVDPTPKGHLGDTALHLAVRYRYLWMIPLLLAKGADPNVQNMNHKSPMDEFKVCLAEALEKPNQARPDNDTAPTVQEWADALKALLKSGATMSTKKSAGNSRNYDEIIRSLPNPEIQMVLNSVAETQPVAPQP